MNPIVKIIIDLPTNFITFPLQSPVISYLNKNGCLPFRKGVVAFIIDDKKNFLIGRMKGADENHWRTIGGGVKPGETDEEALKRELKEELNINNFKVVRKAKNANSFEWPNFVILGNYHRKGILWKGQEQNQYLIKLRGTKPKVIPEPSDLLDAKWVTYDEIKDNFLFEGQWESAKKTLKELLKK